MDCSERTECNAANTIGPGSLVSPAPVFSAWALPFVAILLSLVGVFRLRRRVRERSPIGS